VALEGQAEQPYTTRVRKKRLLWGFLAVVGIIFLSFGIWAYRVGSALAGKGGTITDVLHARTNPRLLFPGKDRLVVLVLGKDYNRDRKGMPYTKGSRADTIMLIGVDLVNPKITAVSIPRDSKITSADGVTDKANSIMVRGGPQLMEDTLSSQFGVTPDYFVVLKPTAVRSIVDALGGVDVDVLDDMNYDDSWGQLHIHLTKGHHHINGAEAEGFVRFRKTEPGKRTHKGLNLEEGDLRRAARQQQLIHAMVESTKSLSNIASLASIIHTGFEQIETNMTQPQIEALGTLFQQAGGGQIEGGTLPGEDGMENGISYWLLDQRRSLKMMQWLINGDQNAGIALPRIAVYNSSNMNAAARSIASTLYAQGYDAFNGGGRAPLAPTSSVTYRMALYQAQANQVANQLGVGPATKDTSSSPLDTWSPEIKVIVGTDLAEKIVPSTPASSSRSSQSSSRSRRRR